MNAEKWKIVYEDSACYVEFYLNEVLIGNAYPTLLINGVARDAELLSDQKTLRVSISVTDVNGIKEVATPRLLISSLRTGSVSQTTTVQNETVDRAACPTALDALSSARYEVVHHDYDYGDEAVLLPGASAKVELRARVYMPKDTSEVHPLVLILHGRHAVCYREGGGSESTWPCSPGYDSIPSHQGYSVAAEALAGHGYTVVSISANGIQPIESSVGLITIGGTLRGHLILAHLDVLAEANKGIRPELSYLAGRLDMDNIGLVGHSRGGEGIARAITLNKLFKKRYGLRAALFLGSTSREGLSIPDTYTATILPFLDGDVYDMAGQAFSDLSRYAFDDDVLHSTVLLLGANHNYFNSVWSPGFPMGADDTAPTWGEVELARLTQEEQRLLGAFYIAGFFRLTLGGEQKYLALFDGSPVKVPDLPQAEVRSSAQFPLSSRYPIQSFETLYSDEHSLRSGRWRWLIKQGVGDIKNKASFASNRRYSHNNYHGFLNLKGETVSSPAVLEFYPPEGTGPVDISAYTHLSFHTFQLPSENPGGAVELHLTIGNVTRDLSQFFSTLWPLPEISPGVETCLEQHVSVPLQDFPVDLTDPLGSITIMLPKGGNIYVSDLAFVKPSLGTIRDIQLPFISIEDVLVVPTGEEQILHIDVTLSAASSETVSLRVYTLIVHTTEGIIRLDAPLVFLPGEYVKTASFVIPPGGFRAESSGPGSTEFYSVIEARGLSNALFERDRALLKTPRFIN